MIKTLSQISVFLMSPSPSKVKEETEHISSNQRNQAGQYPCNRCDKTYKNFSNLK